MTWQPYPRDPQLHYQERGNLVLNAHDNGAWSVYDRTSEYPPRNSVLAPVLGPYTLEDAKLAAEQAAQQMEPW